MPGLPIDLAGLKVSAEDFLAAVLETTAQPIWVVDPEGAFRFVNAAAVATLGYDSAEELLGRNCHSLIHFRHPDGSPYPESECPAMRPRETGETVTCELDWYIRRDDSMFAVSFVSVPIEMPHGRGVVVAFDDIEERLQTERELRDRDDALATQQASLGRVAALVAGGAASAEVLAAIAREVGLVLDLHLVELSRFEPDGTATVIGAWSDRPQPYETGTQWPLDGPTISTLVKETGKPVRVETYEGLPGAIAAAAREHGISCAAGAPIVVDGQLWGSMATCWWGPEPLPEGIEERLAAFSSLITAAFSNTASRDELSRLADEQAALRRVATLVARDVPPADVFAAVARELGLLLGVDAVHMGLYGNDGTVTTIAGWSPSGNHVAIGTRVTVEHGSVSSQVFQTGRTARLHNYDDVAGPAAALGRRLGVTSAVGAPIVVEQRLWGVVTASVNDDRPLPADAESRIGGFIELVATAISNTEARAEVSRLADEQAALRRVATLVAQGGRSSDLFAAVVEEVGGLFGADTAGMIRYVDALTITAVATWAADGEHPPVHGLWPLEGDKIATAILRTGRPAREDDWEHGTGPIAEFVRDTLGLRSSVGTPVIVEGRVWGALFVHSKTESPIPADTESRLVDFTELVATAISNAEARAGVSRLAEEQAALRRVATLVARESPPDEVFAAVASEIGRLLPVEDTALMRYEPDNTATIVALWGERSHRIEIGTRMPIGGDNVTTLVRHTGRPARIDDYELASGDIGAHFQGLGTTSSVGCPIVVEGRLWGVMVAAQGAHEPLPEATEARVEQFTGLIATAISNVQARSDLAASRARIVAAADDERRRVVRDLHDGAQQRLVHTVVTLKMLQQALDSGQAATPDLVGEALDQAVRATDELRDLAQGILPAVLTQGGLRAGVESLALRVPVPVAIEVDVDRLPPAIEATAYFVVAESLTNVAKHSRARRATVAATIGDGCLRVRVQDDGVGGALPDGSGFVGLADRLAVLHGRLRVESPPAGGTLVTADIPLGTPRKPR